MRQLKITKSITNRESASLDKYLQEIGREDLMKQGKGKLFPLSDRACQLMLTME